MSEFQNEETRDLEQYPGMPVQQEMPAGPEKQKKKKKKSGRKGGFAVGLLCGVLIGSLLLGIVEINFFKEVGRGITLGNISVFSMDTSSVIEGETIYKVNQLKSYIDYYYTGDVDEDEIRDGIIHSVVSSLDDPYSVYYTEEEYEDLQVSTTGVYYGIGAGLTQDAETMEVTISKVYEGTPAEEAGLMKNDKILYVEDIEATSMELSALVKQIRGEEGTTVHLTISRDGEKMEFDVERKNITLPSVSGQMLDNNMGYIQISEFQSTTADQFEEIFTNLQAQGMQGVILDVRGNPGGMLDTVVSMLDFLLPEGTVVYTEDKYGNREDYTSDASCIEDMPMVVLCDGSSASASEIFAGALKDYNYATLVGTTTFGKGIVQSIFPLPEGDAVKLTVAKYYTPNGNYIHGVGIEPDIELEYEWTGPEDSTVYEMQYDNQLQKAIEVLGEKISGQ